MFFCMFVCLLCCCILCCLLFLGFLYFCSMFSFSTLILLVASFVSRITYTVLVETLNPAQSINRRPQHSESETERCGSLLS